MCGIIGVINLLGYQIDKDIMHDMCSNLSHRGPDDFGVFHHNNIALAHTRLSIHDLSSAGQQPMFSQSKNGLLFLMVKFIITFILSLYC